MLYCLIFFQLTVFIGLIIVNFSLIGRVKELEDLYYDIVKNIQINIDK